MKKLCVSIACTVLLTVGASIAQAQTKGKSPDAQYIAEATSAAPASVAKNAAVVRMDEKGNTATVRKGSNGFTCIGGWPRKDVCRCQQHGIL